MFRSLHMKLVLIMVLLIVSLMTVVGAFLLNSVVGFYISDFYDQVTTVFEDESLVRDMSTPASGEENGADGLKNVLDACVGTLGVDGRSRNYYILDGDTGAVLNTTADNKEVPKGYTYNLTMALNSGEVSSRSSAAADYMDVAIPITRGENHYIVYLYDNRTTMEALNSEIMMLIIQALIFGLAISVLLSFLLSKTMTDPIEKLTAGAERMAAGEFNERLEVASRDEIGVLTGTFNDMAQQLQETIRQVENERNKLDTLFLHMTDGVVAFSREKEVIHANPAAGVLLACRIDGATKYEDLFGDITTFEQALSVPETAGYLDGEREVRGRILSVLLAPFDRESQEGGVLAVIHDVTEQRKTDELRKEFVANVSHELRTPLTNIRSYAETLADSAGELPPETEQSFLNVILSETDRMTGLVQDLLTLSRFDSGRSELSRTDCDLSAMLEETVRAVKLDAEKHKHTLSLKMEGNLPHICADRERILQVLMNVVANSIKYTPDGGKIEISAGRTEKSVWIEVADNGIGIPPEDGNRIFERFYRVDKARSRESGGTGLGLSIAKEIVDRHQGTIGIVEKDTPGLTIRIELPIEGPDHE